VVVCRSEHDALAGTCLLKSNIRVLIEYTKMSKNQEKGLYHAKVIDGFGE